MGLQLQADLSPAAWIVRSTVPSDLLVTWGPESFSSCARLRYIPDPVRPGQDETDATLPDDHVSDQMQARRAIKLLSTFTSTPDQAYFCWWEGDPDCSAPPDLPLVTLEHRRFALLSGRVADVDAWPSSSGGSLPAFAWPDDRAWCFTSDVDPHWAGIAGSDEAISALVADPQLDVVRASFGEAAPSFY